MRRNNGAIGVDKIEDVDRFFDATIKNVVRVFDDLGDSAEIVFFGDARQTIAIIPGVFGDGAGGDFRALRAVAFVVVQIIVRAVRLGLIVRIDNVTGVREVAVGVVRATNGPPSGP